MSYRIVASALLSRAPLVLPPLTPLEASYYAYQRTLHRALSKPLALSTSWFFKQGSTAEQSFLLSDQKAGKEKGAQGEVDEAFEEVLVREIDGTLEVSVAVETEADRTNDRTSLTRALSRTLYLLVKKPRSSHAWQFRTCSLCLWIVLIRWTAQGGVNSNESLLKAALRELHEETGKDIDVWPTGRVPAAAYSYPLLPSPTSSFTSTRVSPPA